MSFELRPYQSDAIQKLRAEFKAGKTRLMLQAATGSGKTQIAATMIKRCFELGKSALFICDRIELIDQTSRRLDGEGIPHGVIQAQHERCMPWERVQVASIQTLYKRPVPSADLVIIDEAHCLHKAHIRIMDALSNVPVIGLSATPWAKGLGKHFESLVVVATTQDLIDQNYLVEPTVYAPSQPDLEGVGTVAGDYNAEQLGEAADKATLVGDIVSHWFRLAKGRRTICFAVNVAHSKHIVREFQKAGVAAEHLDGYTETEDRHAVIARFRRGEIDVLSSCDILSKGFDAPEASCAILARPTKSLMLYVQQVGRVLRIAGGKSDCVVLDHAGNTERLGFVTEDFTRPLDMGKKAEATSERKEKEEPLPKKCTACHHVKPAKVHTCPKCGFTPERIADVEVEAGTLVEITKGAKAGKAKKEDKQAAYSQLLTVQRERGYRHGWVAHKYQAMFGVWPRGLDETTAPVGDAVRSFLRHLDIKEAKSNNRFSDMKGALNAAR